MQRDHTTDVPSKKRLLNERLDAAERRDPSLRAQLGPVFFLAVIFFLNFVSRIILSPLLPTIEKELAINHSQAGFLFFLSSGGYLVGLLSSGRWWRARRTGGRSSSPAPGSAWRCC